MAIFRGTGGSGNSTDDSIVSAVTTQAGIATTKAGEAATSASNANTSATNAATSATTATTKANEASASATTASTKATEANTAKTAAESAQTAAETARDTAQTHANTANNSSVQTVAGISTEVQNLDNIKTDITSVNTIKSDVTTVAGISSNVTTVAADASDIGTVASNIANVNNVGDNIANVNAVHSNASNINTVAADGTDIGTVASNISNVNTVAGISSDVTTVAGLESKMDTVIADASDIGAVANNISDVSTVAGINADVDTVAGISAKVTTVADNITDVQNADTNAANASTSASQAANSASAAGASATTASTKATEASNSATAASNSATTATTKATEAAGSATTATTKATEASTSATNAATSATTATTKASEAASSATAASGSATTATTKASEASVSAASAATSATDASNAENAWSSFYATYLGSYSAPPTVDVQGNALQTGAFYYDTGAGSNTVGLYVYNGSSWVYSTNYNNVTAPYSLAQDLATNSYDISFGDNAKATFGASNDLEIFHDGTNSRITDTGTGSLILRGQNSVEIEDVSGENMAVFTSNGAATLYYNNLPKIATTSTGIDVTGDIISSGNVGIGTNSPDEKLHIEGNLLVDTSNQSETEGGIFFREGFSDTQKYNLSILTYDHSGNFPDGLSINGFDGVSFCTGSNTRQERMRIDSLGKVGIGTTSPSVALQVESSSGQSGRSLRLAYDGSYYTDIAGRASGGVSYNAVNATAGGHRFEIDGSEKMRLDYSGNVGIGTTSPNRKLQVSTSGTGIIGTFGRTDAASAYITFTDNTTSSDTHVGLGATGNNFFVRAGNAERMRIDSSGNVLVGTASAVVANSSTNVGTAIGAGLIESARAGVVGQFNRHSTDGSIIDFQKDGTTVGSISTKGDDLTIQSSATNHKGLRFGDAYIAPTDNGGNIEDATTSLGTSSNRFKDLYLSGGIKGSTLTFSGNGSTEHARIDSSGNLLVGTTSTVPQEGTHGFVARANGYTIASVDDARVMLVNRGTSDGDLVQFRKNNTTVGSVGTNSGYLRIGTGDTHLLAHSGIDSILPYSGSANRDDSIDLGYTGARFRNLYLSGGVHLGGTGSANKLDDYEEGTFTLTTYGDSTGAFNGTPTCLYTKIGNTVNVFITFRVGTNFTSQSVGGLPFTTSHSGMNSTYISGGIAITSNNNTVSATLSHNGTAIRFHDNQNTSDAHLPNTTDEYYRLNFTYKTA